jgi:hypothetical protein
MREWALSAEQFMTNKLAEADRNQIEVNKIEAASDDKFKSRWRPAAGWVCVVGLGYQVILLPVITWTAALKEWPAPPSLDTATLMGILVPMLGIGVYRTYEKKNGVA